MKKILILGLIISLQSGAFAASYIDKQLKEVKKNVKYNSVKINTRNYSNIDANFKNLQTIQVKDPKLIKLSNVKPIDEKLYNQKLAGDEELYKKEILPVLKKKSSSLDQEPQSVDFYNLYRITERILRANNLEYMNWRIAIEKAVDDPNAFSTMGNLIIINTALYDSLYTNEDALAFIIGHEIAHTILNHSDRKVELNTKLHNYYVARKITGYSVDGMSAIGTAAGEFYQYKKYFNELKMMEFMADAEGMNLAVRAGYSPSNAMYAMNYLDTLPEYKNLFGFDSHPMVKDRIQSLQENIYYINPQWKDEGRYNIYNSSVLSVKKSSDRVSIIINKNDNVKNFYTPENIEQRLTRLAYVSYINGNMKNAIKYFDKLSEIKSDYVTYLYLSYANEYLYNQTKEEKYKKCAKKAIEQAYALNATDSYVKEQKENL